MAWRAIETKELAKNTPLVIETSLISVNYPDLQGRRLAVQLLMDT